EGRGSRPKDHRKHEKPQRRGRSLLCGFVSYRTTPDLARRPLSRRLRGTKRAPNGHQTPCSEREASRTILVSCCFCDGRHGLLDEAKRAEILPVPLWVGCGLRV